MSPTILLNYLPTYLLTHKCFQSFSFLHWTESLFLFSICPSAAALFHNLFVSMIVEVTIVIFLSVMMMTNYRYFSFTLSKPFDLFSVSIICASNIQVKRRLPFSFWSFLWVLYVMSIPFLVELYRAPFSLRYTLRKSPFLVSFSFLSLSLSKFSPNVSLHWQV